MTNYSWILIILGFLSIIIELIVGVATGFDLVLLGIAFIIGGFVGLYFFSWELGILVAGILSLLYIIMGRRIIKNRLSIHSSKSNMDALINQKAVVIKQINPHRPGQIKIEGEIWRAHSEEVCEVGETVVIKSVDGVTLTVVQSN